MNYRHAFHAGNFADLHKHAILLAMLSALQGESEALSVIEATLATPQPATAPGLVRAERRRFALMFQDFALFPHLDVWDNVAFGLVERGEWPKDKLLAVLDVALTRADDRALFDLQAPATEPAFLDGNEPSEPPTHITRPKG